jgi:hypothetical protein
MDIPANNQRERPPLFTLEDKKILANLDLANYNKIMELAFKIFDMQSQDQLEREVRHLFE